LYGDSGLVAFTLICPHTHYKLTPPPHVRTLALVGREEELHGLLHGWELGPANGSRAIASTAAAAASTGGATAFHKFALSGVRGHGQSRGGGGGRMGG